LGTGFWNDEDEDDKDIQADPLFTLDLKITISESLRTFAAEPAAAQQLLPMLSPSEQLTVQTALQ
jgi:hypothetical protein